MDADTAFESLTRAILDFGLAKDTRILVAVSGGADSVALLEVLRTLADKDGHEWTIRVGHVNHLVRGEEAEEDERFVRRVAEERGLNLDLRRVDTGGHAARHHLSLETAARELRYRALHQMLADWPGDVIATGHTADDQAETLLLRLIRGSGLRGLGAMHPQRGNIIRPFLAVRHATVLASLQRPGSGYRLDTSNRDDRHRRNYVRRHIVPALAALQPDVIPVLARTAEILQVDSDYLQRSAREAFDLLNVKTESGEISADRAVWRALHPGLRNSTLFFMLESLIGYLTDIEAEHVKKLAESVQHLSSGSALIDQLPHGLSVYVDASRFALRIGTRPPQSTFEAGNMSVPGEATLEIGSLSGAILSVDDSESITRMIRVCGPLHALCDADRVGNVLQIRPRRPGDRMRPLGFSGSRKLQDILVDRRIPRALRDRLPIITRDDGAVWIPGIALDRDIAVTDATARIIHLRWRPAGPR